jgi:uncharacterized protein YbjT (DUF2867 family)
MVRDASGTRERARNRAKAIADLGIEMVEADFDRPETLLSALAGVDRAFLVTNSTEHTEAQQLAFVEAAKQSGVKHIVKLSQFAANADSPVRFLRYHAAVESAIQATQMAYRTHLTSSGFCFKVLETVKSSNHAIFQQPHRCRMGNL